MTPEHLSARLLDNLSTAVLLVDADMRVSYLNVAAETLFEVSRGRIIGESVTRVFRADEDTLGGLRRALQTGTGFTRRRATFHLGIDHDLTVDYAVTPVALDTDSLLIEINPLHRLMRISREEAIVSTQQRTQSMLRGLAHEIKNPLGGLRGAAQLLARELSSEHLLEYTRVIIEEADRLRNLVDRMLSTPRKPQKQPLNIHEVLERVRQLVEAESQQRIVIQRDYDPSIPEFLGDREQLIQALLNVTRNAQQALQEAGIADPEIRFRTRTQRQLTIANQRHRLACQIDITDNGPGIPPELVDSIFYPLVSGRAEGTGLGLAISQSIINQHHGLIECSSRPGQTVFSILIPLESTHE